MDMTTLIVVELNNPFVIGGGAPAGKTGAGAIK
jgi:hypothetical protein